MNLQMLCTNCMLGTTEHTVCPFCGKTADWDMSRPMSALPSRTILGQQYILGRVLGCGGFGITYLAWDMKNQTRVAVKELFPEKDMTRNQQNKTVNIVTGQEQYVAHIRQRFLEEAQALYSFSNQPDIINVYRLFEENGTAYYAMEYLDGMDLKHILATNGRMNWQQLSGYLIMIFRALMALHKRNLIHRDISPDNIFITKDNRAKLIDFGSLRSYSNSNGLTTILKQCFAPYEQYRTNGNQGPWTDIYALSVTMYYALAGVLPPKAPDRLFTDKTVPIKQYCPDLSDRVADAIMKGMAVQPENRFQLIQDYARELGIYEAVIAGNSSGQNVNQQQICNQQAQVQAQVQAQQAQVQQQRPLQANQSVIHVFRCVQGGFVGRQWNLTVGTSLLIGRDQTSQIAYPVNYQGVSRRQCTVILDRQIKLWVRDEHSSYGTWVNDTRLEAGKWYIVQPGSKLLFGQEVYQIG